MTGVGTVCWNALDGLFPVEPLGAAAVVLDCVPGTIGGLVVLTIPAGGAPSGWVAAPAGRLLLGVGAVDAALDAGGVVALPV